MSTVRDNRVAHRYEICDEDQLAGFSEHKLSKGKIAFTHAEVDPALNGRGLAGRLVAQELAGARDRGLAVFPFCPHARTVIAHPSRISTSSP